MIVEGRTMAEVVKRIAGSGMLNSDELPYFGAALTALSKVISDAIETTKQDAVRKSVVSLAIESGHLTHSLGRSVGRVFVKGLAGMLLLASLGGFLEGDSPAAF